VLPLLQLGVPLLQLGVPLLQLGVPLLQLGVPLLQLGVPLFQFAFACRCCIHSQRLPGFAWAYKPRRWPSDIRLSPDERFYDLLQW
jgi:hypothetical protein